MIQEIKSGSLVNPLYGRARSRGMALCQTSNGLPKLDSNSQASAPTPPKKDPG